MHIITLNTENKDHHPYRYQHYPGAHHLQNYCNESTDKLARIPNMDGADSDGRPDDWDCHQFFEERGLTTLSL